MEQMCSLNKRKTLFQRYAGRGGKDGMEYRTLGLSGLRISAVGLGCMGMSHAYGAPADKCKITELLTDAVDMGYTFLTRPKCMVHRTGRMVMKNCWEKRCSRSATKL